MGCECSFAKGFRKRALMYQDNEELERRDIRLALGARRARRWSAHDAWFDLRNDLHLFAMRVVCPYAVDL